MLSSFTLISLVGVMLGVLVLVVVMAVYAGLEREVKDRILGFTPHILMQGPPDETGRSSLGDWSQARELAMRIPYVKSATPFISDHVIIDHLNSQRPVMFTAIDTSDAGQVKGLEDMLDQKKHPGSSADLGIDDRAVISSVVAEQFGLAVGDTVRLYSTRNFEGVMRVYKATEKPPVREHYKKIWQDVTSLMGKAWKPSGSNFFVDEESYRGIYAPLLEILENDSSLRDAERQLLEDLLYGLDGGPKEEEKKGFIYSGEQKSAIMNSWNALGHTDPEKMDGDALKGLKKIVLPKEVKISGVYQSSMMAATPDLFLPLPLAQALAGLEDGAVQGVALRLTDPYDAEKSAAVARRDFGDRFSFLTWGDQYSSFFALIKQQRMMMYFALSFIVLVSAFSMMAVMFTVTILKRREIGVMKAVGAAPGQIVRVFLYQGMLLGILGAVLGIVLGRVVIHFRGPIQGMFRAMNFDPFSSAIMGSDVMPAHHNPAEQMMIGLIAFVFCSVAALVPAFFAARSDAAKSLRNL